MKDEDGERSYTIWGFGALFVVLVAVGTWAVVAFGTQDRELTEELPVGSSTTGPEDTTSTVAVPPTMLDGSPAPPEVYEVVVAPGKHTYLFTLPDGVDDEPTDSVVAPSTVAKSDDELHLTVNMVCAVSDGSVPAALTITEDPFEVNVIPVVIGDSFGPACPPLSVVGTIEVALDEPVGARRLVLAQAGTPVVLGDIG